MNDASATVVEAILLGDRTRVGEFIEHG